MSFSGRAALSMSRTGESRSDAKPRRLRRDDDQR
jgi:hypothetical protein